LKQKKSRRFVDVPDELKICPAGKKFSQYNKEKWLNHVSRMKDTRHPNNSLTIDLSEREEDVTRRIE